MAPRVLAVAVMAASLVAANINFTWVQPSCGPDDPFNRRPSGQHCENATCVPDYDPRSHHRLAPAHPEKRTANLMLGRARHGRRQTVSVTMDGTCGAANGGTVCGSRPQGGWCGNAYVRCLPPNCALLTKTDLPAAAPGARAAPARVEARRAGSLSLVPARLRSLPRSRPSTGLAVLPTAGPCAAAGLGAAAARSMSGVATRKCAPALPACWCMLTLLDSIAAVPDARVGPVLHHRAAIAFR